MLFYIEMLLIRAKLQFYRINQIRAVKWFSKSFKSNYGLYICGALFLAYFGHFRKNQKAMLEMHAKNFDKTFREFLKYAMAELLFSNSWIDDLTGKALYDLTQVPKY